MNLDKCDRAFSRLIRLENSDENGKCKCVTCEHVDRWQDMECGHYVPRANMSLRYSKVNCGPQCPKCNKGEGGNLKAFEYYLIQKHGSAIIEWLQMQKHQTVKFTQIEIDCMESSFKDEIKKILK
jgi:hypothetical protein